MAAGLKVLPLGGYRDVEAKPWVPLGNTGVIRGSERNAQVVADSPLDVLRDCRIITYPFRLVLLHANCVKSR